MESIRKLEQRKIVEHCSGYVIISEAADGGNALQAERIFDTVRGGLQSTFVDISAAAYNTCKCGYV
jgi:hypothetical protein